MEIQLDLWPRILIPWYEENLILYPWREDPTPYHVWISEVMLQQTRLSAAGPFYIRFLEAFPDLASLAEAKEEDVLKCWEGLGYYSRAKNLMKTARIIRDQYQGKFPEDAEVLAKLPGIGPYTAGAISAIAFHKDVLAVDGNVLRVVARLYCLYDDVLSAKARKNTEEILRRVYPSAQASSFVQGLMELGETLCVPSGPHCDQCPLKEYCRANREGKTEQLPIRLPKTVKKTENKKILLIHQQDRILIHLRPSKGVLAGLWEFPDERTLCQDHISFSETETIGQTRHVFTHLIWEMTVCQAVLNTLKLPDAYRLVTAEEIEKQYMLPVAFQKAWRLWKR